jgi:hypothetical protein
MAFAGQLILVPDLDFHAGAAGDRRRLFGERLRIHVVGRRVDEPACEIHAIAEQNAAIDCLRRRADPDGGAEPRAFLVAAVEILADHAHHAARDGLLDLPRAPCAVGHEGHPRAGFPGEVAGGRGGGPVERAGIELLALAQAHDNELRHAEAGRSQQGYTLVAVAGDLSGRHEPAHETAGGTVDVGAHAGADAACGEKQHECVGLDGFGTGGRVGDDGADAAQQFEFRGHGRASQEA